MRVLLVTAGEPLPFDRADIRLHRTGQFAAWLVAQGHTVDWVTNRFDHFRRIHRAESGVAMLQQNYRIHLLESRGYRATIGPSRMRDHVDLGRAFRVRTAEFGRPDVVLAAMPTIELAAASVEWASRVGAVSLVDVRDLWPDIMVERAPAAMRWMARLALSRLFRTVREALRNADGIIALNPAFLDWGLDHAHRAMRQQDSVIPLGYELRPVSENDLGSAMQFWSERGLALHYGAPPILAFAGSVSSVADFTPVLDASKRLAARGVRTVVCGVGARLEELRRVAPEYPGLLLAGWCSYPQIRVLLEHATVGLLPYRDSVNYRNHLPNKAGEYLAHGLPIAWSLGTGPLARMIAERDVGFSYGNDGETLAEAVDELLGSPTRMAACRAASRALFEAEFDAAAIHQRMFDHLTLVTSLRAGVT